MTKVIKYEVDLAELRRDVSIRKAQEAHKEHLRTSKGHGSFMVILLMAFVILFVSREMGIQPAEKHETYGFIK